ncbi:MAG TPA: MoxR family ATPase [Saprospirales bacterium]|nr:MoxR family ATPase [Saprospirales bacterium]
MKINIIDRPPFEFDPEKYIMDDGLRNAVEVAIALNQPLLLTGEPGTGKTRLADKVAHELAKDKNKFDFAPEPLIFNTKSSSAARDLFYTYDAVSHFAAANLRRDNLQQSLSAVEYLELQALGLAIARTNPATVDPLLLNTDPYRDKPRSSVVLIDEIDKAPRDFPNDLLFEIERQEFLIKELENYPLRREPGQRIVVILTSNSEKNLPDAFLRRCVFYHIPFPDKAQLIAIAKTQLGGATRFTEQLLDELITKFNAVRDHAVRKAPATAELLGWLQVLDLQDYVSSPEDKRKEIALQNLSLLVKTREDMEAVRKLF